MRGAPTNVPPRLLNVSTPSSPNGTHLTRPMRELTLSQEEIPKDENWNNGQKYNVPCRYFKWGTCKLGDQCRFLHNSAVTTKTIDLRKSGEQISLNSSNGNLRNSGEIANVGSDFGNLNINPIPPEVQYRYSRRPLLHVIVLYAGDLRVLRYSKELQNLFLDNGIDVYLQTKTDDDQYIKTENLAEIITNSKADYVVVIGDRNMKNKSCQTKKKGKLVETQVDETINFIWGEWAELHSDHYATDDTSEILYKVCALRNLDQRIEKLEQGLKSIKDVPPFLNAEQPTYIEAKAASKITNFQKQLIRFHQQLVSALEILEDIPIENEKTPDNSGRGVAVGPEHQTWELVPGISEGIKTKLLDTLNDYLPKLEEIGDELNEVGNPLWMAYLQEYNKAKEIKASKPKEKTPKKSHVTATGGTWSCTACTFVNSEDILICEMCQEPRKAVKESQWSMSGAARKLKKKPDEKDVAPKEPEDKKKEKSKQDLSIRKPEGNPQAKYKPNDQTTPISQWGSHVQKPPTEAWNTQKKPFLPPPVRQPTAVQGVSQRIVPAPVNPSKPQQYESNYSSLSFTSPFPGTSMSYDFQSKFPPNDPNSSTQIYDYYLNQFKQPQQPQPVRSQQSNIQQYPTQFAQQNMKFQPNQSSMEHHLFVNSGLWGDTTSDSSGSSFNSFSSNYNQPEQQAWTPYSSMQSNSYYQNFSQNGQNFNTFEKQQDSFLNSEENSKNFQKNGQVLVMRPCS